MATRPRENRDMGKGHDRKGQQPRHLLTEEPDGYNTTGCYRVRDAEHFPGSNNIIGLSEIQGFPAQGIWGSCSILAAAPLNVRVRVHPRNESASFTFFHAGTSFVIRTSTRLNGTNSSGVLGWLEKAYSVGLRKTGRVKQGLTAWEEMNDGNHMETALEMMTGRDAVHFYEHENPTPQHMDAALANGQTVMVATLRGDHPMLVYNHAYRVHHIDPLPSGDYVFYMTNPWGYDGKQPWGNPNDGVVAVNTQMFNDAKFQVTIG